MKPEPRGHLAGTCVLVVEDDPDLCELLALVLAKAGAVVRTADCAAGALELLGCGRFDVLVCDAGLPDLDGWSLIEEVRARGVGAAGHIPAITLTGRTSPDDVATSLAAGFDLHVGKPANLNALVASIARLTGRGGAASTASSASWGASPAAPAGEEG